MKFNLKLTTNRYFFIGSIIFLVGILTLINNYYFYGHIERSGYRNASQLKEILIDEIRFCRKNKISGKRYRKNIETIVKNFANKAYYNDTLILIHENKGVIWEKSTADWDKVVASHIEIILPKLKSDNELYYDVYVKFDNYLYFISVIRSMTFSVFDKGAKLFNTSTIKEDEKKLFYILNKKLYKYKSTEKRFNKLLGKKYKNTITNDEKKLYKELEKELLLNKFSDNELENYEILKRKIKESKISSYDIKTAWYRSRPALGFTIFAIVLVFLFRRREKQMIEIERELEKEQKNKEILERIFGINEKNDEIELYEAIMNNDISKLKNIKSINPTISIIKFNAMVDHTEDEKLRILQVLIDKGISLKFDDEEGMTALMYYAIGNINDKNSKIIETLIKNGVDIDAQNKSGMTALMLCSKNNRPASVQILIDNGANINIKQDLNAKELAATKEIEEIIKTAENHTPQKLVNILKNFRKDNPIKFTTHDWDSSFMKHYEEDYNNFDGFLDVIEQEWEKVASELKELSPNLYKKIYSFLLSKDATQNWYSKDGDAIAIGWRSLEGLREWCDDGGNPFNYKLPNSYKANNKTITTFGEVVELFKHEIQFRNKHEVFNQKDTLNKLFLEISKNLHHKYNGLFEIKLLNLKHKEFYTDVENLTNAINMIFKEIEAYEEFKKIKIEVLEEDDASYYDIKITHIGSKSGQNSKDMFEKISGGNSSMIKECLKNLCDWSIQSSHGDENYRINALSSNNIDDIELLEYEPEGFTHILRFYK